MAVEISLRAVVDELDGLLDESVAYLNRKTGEFYSVRDEEARMVEDSADPDDLPEWLGDEMPKIREVVEPGDWLPLPARFEIHEWAFMDDFARGHSDPDLREELLTALCGRGAFRAFTDAIHRLGIQQSWHDFKTAALGRIAADWLDEHGIPYTNDIDTSSTSS